MCDPSNRLDETELQRESIGSLRDIEVVDYESTISDLQNFFTRSKTSHTINEV